jgi:Zn-dependent peptidase ImmA (M78 family)
MNLAISRIKQIIPHFNEQALTEKDFWLLCEKENIRVVEANLIVDGFYYCDGRRPHIFLNSALRGVFWLENAFHEIAHHFLHTPPRCQRQETEARAIALIAILPRSQLEKAASEADEFSEYAERILHERVQILQQYGI